MSQRSAANAKTVLVRDIVIKGSRVSATITVKDREYDIFYEFPAGTVITSHPANAFLVLTLPVAMSVQARVEIEGAVSESLLDQLQTYQEILQKWYYDRGLRKVEITASSIYAEPDSGGNTESAATFTGGVDSFYTLLRHKEEISKLFYIHGLDIRLESKDFLKKVSRHLRSVAQNLGIDLIEPVSNCKLLLEDYVDWRDIGYGPAIASTILLTNHNIKTFYIPGAEDYNFLEGGGTHILINPLWNCDGTSFIYDGPEASRIQKVDYIVGSHEAQQNLRVCWQPVEEYNCGRCEKCIRTMVSIDLVGDISKYKKVFPVTYSPTMISETSIINDAQKSMAVDSYKYAESVGRKDVSGMLKALIDRYDSLNIYNQLKNNVDMLLFDPRFKEIRKAVVDHEMDTNLKYLLKNMPAKLKTRAFKLINRQ